MKNRFVTLCVAAVLGLGVLAGCSESPGQVLKTAQFEEKQGNLDHAGELYQKIIRQNPESPEAAEAKAGMARIMEKRGGMK